MIVNAMYFIILAGNLIVALPVAIFLFEVLAAITLTERTFEPLLRGKNRDRVGVLIPAHNEEEVLSRAIVKIQPQLRPEDRLLVVADNCSDRTAAMAEVSGADVIVRTDPDKRGKGFALDYGIRHFAKDPPKTVIVVDADCTLCDLAIDHLAAMSEATNRPVQALDLMIAAPNLTRSTRVREFAWRIKNWIRPLGLSSAGLPCQLMGTGMAFPWEIIASANLATGALVEDLKLGLELAADGHPPIFCPEAIVTSEFPTTHEGARSQQVRWEQGHLGLIAVELPRFFLIAVRKRNVNLLVLTLDAAVPPLSLLWIIVALNSLLNLCAWVSGFIAITAFLSLGNILCFMCATVCCWLKNGRDILSIRSLLLIGLGSFRKVPLYCRIVLRKTGAAWIRTERRRM
jgi:cellulose synthase/poly-beta-1,6-N-acetylglucosamine synthase-like glycosyltransferase